MLSELDPHPSTGTAAKDTISKGSGDRVNGADRLGMEVHEAFHAASSITSAPY